MWYSYRFRLWQSLLGLSCRWFPLGISSPPASSSLLLLRFVTFECFLKYFSPWAVFEVAFTWCAGWIQWLFNIYHLVILLQCYSGTQNIYFKGDLLMAIITVFVRFSNVRIRPGYRSLQEQMIAWSRRDSLLPSCDLIYIPENMAPD